MQSGRARTGHWVIEPDRAARLEPEPLMGWVSSQDTLNTIRLSFPTRDEAVDYAERQGWPYTVDAANDRKIKPKAYADNFRHDRLVPWSH